MSRGFLNHIWYKLLDEEGVLIPSASIWIYDYENPTTQLTLFDENEDQITQPITTDSNGILEFFVKDHIRTSGDGYTWYTQFIISWSKEDKSGIIRGDNLFGEFESVNISGSSLILNKTISNFLGWTYNDHADFKFGSTTRCGSSSSSSSSQSSSSISNSSSSSSSESSTITMGMSAYYKMDEITGIDVNNEYGPSGTMIHPPSAGGQWVTAEIDNGISLIGGVGGSGILDYIDTNELMQGWLRADKSISMWIKPNDGQPDGHHQRFCGSNSNVGGAAAYWYVGLNSNGSLDYNFYWDNGLYAINGSSNGTFNFSNGTQSSFTNVIYTISNTDIYIYVNGAQVHNFDTTGADYSGWDSNRNVLIGCGATACFSASYDVDACGFSGVIDDVRFYNGILTLSDAQDIYNKII